jgi:hypothetical protein
MLSPRLPQNIVMILQGIVIFTDMQIFATPNRSMLHILAFMCGDRGSYDNRVMCCSRVYQQSAAVFGGVTTTDFLGGLAPQSAGETVRNALEQTAFFLETSINRDSGDDAHLHDVAGVFGSRGPSRDDGRGPRSARVPMLPLTGEQRHRCRIEAARRGIATARWNQVLCCQQMHCFPCAFAHG